MTASVLPVQRDESGVATITLEQPGSPVVVLNLELLQRLEATLHTLRETPPTGMILASASERVFVAGADLATIRDESDDGLDKYLAYGQRVFAMIAELGCPTVAAVNGAALGGGLELAMHCDGIVGCRREKPFPIGLPEAGLGICPGWGGTNLLPARVDPADAIRRTCAGKAYKSDEAEAAGLFDAVADDAAALPGVALAWLKSAKTDRRDGSPSRWIGRPSIKARVLAALVEVRDEATSTEPGRGVVRAIESGLEEGYGAGLTTERRELIRLRALPQAVASIEAFFAKSKAKA